MNRKANNAFYWIDDTPLADQYATWDSGEPTYFHEKCAHTCNVLEKLGKRNDLRCNLDETQKYAATAVLNFNDCCISFYLRSACLFFLLVIPPRPWRLH